TPTAGAPGAPVIGRNTQHLDAFEYPLIPKSFSEQSVDSKRQIEIQHLPVGPVSKPSSGPMPTLKFSKLHLNGVRADSPTDFA
ncbi:MAG TPA: hypothetical protein VI685_07770, partial [Candidatus Angelobacter sp.]